MLRCCMLLAGLMVASGLVGCHYSPGYCDPCTGCYYGGSWEYRGGHLSNLFRGCGRDNCCDDCCDTGCGWNGCGGFQHGPSQCCDQGPQCCGPHPQPMMPHHGPYGGDGWMPAPPVQGCPNGHFHSAPMQEENAPTPDPGPNDEQARMYQSMPPTVYYPAEDFGSQGMPPQTAGTWTRAF